MNILKPVHRKSASSPLKALLVSVLTIWVLIPQTYPIRAVTLSVPIITSFSPSTGPAGTSVIINGENLSGVTSVKFNGASADFNFFGSQITALVPESATTGRITVTTLDGTATSASDFVVTVSLPPQIDSFTPASGPAGTQVTINGQHLASATSVSFSGVSATFSVDFSGANLLAKVPANATSGTITVVTPTGTDTSFASFTVTALPSPVVTSFIPISGPVGTLVTINGRNLTGTTAVKFNGKNAFFTVGFFGATITAFVPTAATTGLITIEHPAGTAVSANNFTVTAPAGPTITSFSPNNGQEEQEVTIEGTNLSGATSVFFNGKPAPFTVFGSSSIFTIVPSGASTGRITVVTPAGPFTSLTDFFVGAFVDLEVSVSTSANPVNPGENFTYTVTVTNEGLADAHDVTLSDLLPDNAKIVFVFSTSGACADLNQNVTCNFGSLAKGASAIAKIIVTPAGGPEINTTFHASTSDFEPSSENNSASLTTTVTREGLLVIGIEAGPGKNATISWPANATGFLLEVTDSLVPPAFWKPVTDIAQISGQKKTVTRGTTVGNQFFRLRKP